MATILGSDRLVRNKLVIVGQPHSGKEEILKSFAGLVGSQVAEGIIGDTRVIRSRVKDGELGKTGWQHEIDLFAVVGEAPLNAASQLVMSGCDALLVVIDCRPNHVNHSREVLQAMVDNLRRNKLDPAFLPIVLQYHRSDLNPAFDAHKLDVWLGVDGSDLTRISTSSVPSSTPSELGLITALELTRENSRSLIKGFANS